MSISKLTYLLFLLFPVVVMAQEGNFITCYLNQCNNAELTALQIGSTDQIEVKSIIDGDTYGIISFTVTFMINGEKLECTCRENKLSARCLALRDKLSVDDEMIISDVVFKDIKGGGKIRTAPELKITVVKPYEDE